ncbi:MAG TPA: hypothetical protein PK543_00935 [Candidatus Saccharibacteria bacterium]|nr:hypothetical protein [Candidatus Saccharibacteria bacterium]
MLPLTLNPLPVLISLTAAFSVLVHDSQIDFAAMTALAVPAAIITGDVVGLNLAEAGQHVHAERSSGSRAIRNTQAATPPRNENDKKYVAQRRLLGDSFGSEFYWPSI